ncbi:MAG: RNA polymerase sigma-70 factor [Bacteroidia bacterium]|nr:RNA polymerase sigma-70 factor [Bacteroidia bacterium]
MSESSSHTYLTESQFEDLFKSHFQFLCNFARQYVGDDELAQDLTQKVFITLWEKRESIDTQLSVKSYLFTILKNRCLNYLRDQKKYRSKLLDVDCGDLEVSVEEDPLAEEELREQIEEALNALPEKCRLVFEMSRFRGMKYKEIAEELELSQKTVEAHMSKAIKSLRKYLAQWLGLILLLLTIFVNKN